MSDPRSGAVTLRTAVHLLTLRRETTDTGLMCVEQSGSSLVERVREAAMSVVGGEIVVTAEARNSVIVLAVEQNYTSTSTKVSPVVTTQVCGAEPT